MIGRKEEIQELTNFYDSKEAQFVAIYGRRRVGKTYLVNETFQGKFTFRHAGLRINEGDAARADEVFSTLMGNKVAPRSKFIEENAQYATLDI